MRPGRTEGQRVLIVDDDRALRLALRTLLEGAGFSVAEAADGPDALARLTYPPPDVMLLDIGLPGIGGLEVLAHARTLSPPPRVVIITADETPETLLRAVSEQADRFLVKPFAPSTIIEVVNEVLGAMPAAALPIEVISARPEWVELVAPCALDVADRIQSFVMHLDADLTEHVRESVGQAFRELLNNAIEWGGRCDPTRTVRISCLRARRMLLYRIADPGPGFKLDNLEHAAIANPDDDPLAHAAVREEKGLRPGGLGLALTRELVDELLYNEKRNEVVLIKYLE
jgi:CheY-like chemotaxis protein/anti-sigma regulatory factor (Ser/Thr protein kinase)